MKMLSPHQKQVLELWHKGHSGLRIAQMLGTSRSAVLGLLKRIRDWGHDTTRSIDLAKAEKALAKKEKKEAIKANLNAVKATPANVVRLPAPKRSLEPPPKPIIPVEKPAPVDDLKPVRFNNLKPHHCRYVINSGHASTFLFCGKPKAKSSYCEEHHKLVYVPMQPKRR